MYTFSKSEQDFLRQNLPSLFSSLSSISDSTLIDALDEWMAENGFDDEYDLTDEGRIAQRILDKVYFDE